MKPTALYSFFFLSLLISCTPENRVFEEHQSLSPNIEWLKEDVKEFNIKVKDIDSDYTFNLAFRYANGYMWNEAKVILEEISPSGEKMIIPYSLKIREDNGDYIGDAGYDIWDSTHPIETDYRFKEVGTYTYRISHDMPRDDFPFAMEIGVILDRNE